MSQEFAGTLGMAHFAIVDYGVGNVSSIARMIAPLGASHVFTCDPEHLRSSTHLILPGVGHCRKAMEKMHKEGTLEVLQELVMTRKMPVLGICLGMQLMTSYSEEAGMECLGWFAERTLQLRPLDTRKLKVPNIGWHLVRQRGDSRIFDGIALDRSPFYFCHKYAVAATSEGAHLADFTYGERYIAALQRDNIVGVQFHPEKSQDAGERLMRNVLQMSM